jgi:D-amino-acid dehydrogenase
MIQNRSDVLVIGGGVIGLSAAYYLAMEGAKVTVLERGLLGQGASCGNAGLIVPSYSIPMATPARLLEGLKWVFRRGSPISMDFRANRELFGWLLRFTASCTSTKAASTTRLLFDLGRMSMELFKSLPGLREAGGFEQAGWLHLYRTAGGLAGAAEEARFLGRAGVRSLTLGPGEVRELEPAARENLAGGIHYPDEAHVVPDLFTGHLALLAREAGAVLCEHIDVGAFEQDGRLVRAVHANGAEYRAGSYILATGAWSPRLARSLGLRLPVQGARGYSLDFGSSRLTLQRPLLLGEAHVIARPLGDRNRITGGFELARPDSGGSASMPKAILNAPDQYLSNVESLAGRDVWFGFRPVSPDGIPFIGPTSRFPNLLLATGHGTLGMTLSLVTGRLLTDLITGRLLPAGLHPLLPSRVGL